MRIERTSAKELTITGNIKTTADYLEIRNMATEVLWGGGSELTLRINDSLSMPSSVIGFFVKLANRDQVRLTMVIEDPRLLELLDELSLTAVFGARL
jgi:hypothetical protein